MTDLLQPWVWYALGLILICVLIYGAAFYEAWTAPREYHDHCSRVDEELTREGL